MKTADMDISLAEIEAWQQAHASTPTDAHAQHDAPRGGAPDSLHALNRPFVPDAPSPEEMTAAEQRANPDAGAPTPHDGPEETIVDRAGELGRHIVSTGHDAIETAEAIAPEAAEVAEHSPIGRLVGGAAPWLSLGEAGQHIGQIMDATDERQSQRAKSEFRSTSCRYFRRQGSRAAHSTL
jgi:hypothetical protein